MNDVIVIGLGSMGSSTLYHLAKAGVKVLGLEQFGITHNKGSHSGETRIVRKAYFEHPNYVPLLESAYEGWEHLEDEIENPLFIKTGLAYIGDPNHPVLQGVKSSSNKYGIPLERDQRFTFSPFEMPKNAEILFEPNAGFSLTEQTIKTLVKLAAQHGALVQSGEQVVQISQEADHVVVKTSKKVYRSAKLVVTSGAYINEIIEMPKIEQKVTRQLVFWVEPKKRTPFKMGNFPSWMIADDDYPGVFYGFPILPTSLFGGSGLLKIAHHTSGEAIHPKNLSTFDSKDEEESISRILAKYIPDALGEIKKIEACMYTNSPDGDFILDFLPDSNQKILIATGFSGHGFKFVPVIGEILKDLALEGETKYPIQFLRLNRFK